MNELEQKQNLKLSKLSKSSSLKKVKFLFVITAEHLFKCIPIPM